MDLPAFQSFMTPSNMDFFWRAVKWLLFLVAPIIMIFFASDIVEGVIGIIRRVVKPKKGRRDDDDDDDYEVRYYR